MSDEVLPYEVIKGLQVLKYITSKHSDKDYYKVLKIIYLADKIHLPKHGKLIVPDKYLKYEHGPVPSLCYEIIQFLLGKEKLYNHPFDESIKKEIEVIENPKNLKRTKLHNLTEPDLDYLSKSNIKCLDEAIEKYGDCDFSKLKELSHDEIYNSVPDEEITIIDMANILDETGDLADHLRETYPYKII